MSEFAVSLYAGSEPALVAAAGEVARRWAAAGIMPLLVGLRGDLGSGKTTWVRAMLRGLGHAGRVPSPTYTLVEHYPLGGLTVVHLDLYRIGGEDELEHLGLRDWLAQAPVWLLVEWPERAESIAALADVVIALEIANGDGRRVRASARTERGRSALAAFSDLDSSNRT